MFEKVLVPLDGSGVAESILPLIKPLLMRVDSLVLLLQVAQYPAVPGTADPVPLVEFEKPARRYIDDARTRVVDGVALALERIERETQLVRAGLAGGQIDRHAGGGRLGRQLDVARGDQRLAIVDAQARGGCSRVTNADLRSHGRAHRRVRRHFQALQLQVAGDLFGTDADCVDRHAIRGDLGQTLLAERAAVLGAIAEQHHTGKRHAAGALQDLHERVADACLRTGLGHRIQGIERSRGLREAEQPHLERVFELCERVLLQRSRHVLQPRTIRIAIRHAAGCIDGDREHVLTIAHALDVQHRPPEQAQDRRGEQALEDSDRHEQLPAELPPPPQGEGDDRDGDEDRGRQHP